MKKCWKLSRGKRIVLNLTLAALLQTLIWGLMGYPLPPRANFRRVERANLVGPSEIQGIFRDDAGDWWVVGMEQDQAVLFQSNRTGAGGVLSFWPKVESGAALVPVPTWVSQFGKEQKIMAVDVPESTASAQMELSMSCWHQVEDPARYQVISSSQDVFEGEPFWWEQTCTVDGELLKNGGVLFRVASPDEHTDTSVNIASVERMALGAAVRWDTYLNDDIDRAVNCHMEAVFYNENGAELSRATLSTLKGGTEDAS